MNIERRNKPRISEPVSLIVRSSSSCNAGYQFSSTTKNIGAGGLCAFAPRAMEVGEKVTLFVRLALVGSNPPQAPDIAARAIVVRVEEKSEESCTFAVSFLRHRFI
jgi:c-di-GMP-binding flagellar brake protein YcgR